MVAIQVILLRLLDIYVVASTMTSSPSKIHFFYRVRLTSDLVLPPLSFLNHRHVHNNTSFFFHFHVVCYLPIARRVCNIIVVSLGEEDWRGNQPSKTGSQELMPPSRKATPARFRAREARQRTDEEDASRVTDDPRSPLAPRAGRHQSVWLGEASGLMRKAPGRLLVQVTFREEQRKLHFLGYQL